MTHMAIIYLPLPIAIEMMSRWVKENPTHEDAEIIEEILREAEFSNQLPDSGISSTAIN